MANVKLVIITAASLSTIIIAFAIFFPFAAISKLNHSAASQQGNGNAILNNSYYSFEFNNHTYNFTGVAASPAERARGLMNSNVLNSTFELFVCPKFSDDPFWMKDMLYPVDIIWMNGSTVVNIVSAQPCSSYDQDQISCPVYPSGTYYDYVIEAHMGFADSIGLHVGDSVVISAHQVQT